MVQIWLSSQQLLLILAKPNENAKANFLTASVNDKKAVIAVTGSAFTTNCPTYYGTYTYKVTSKRY